MARPRATSRPLAGLSVVPLAVLAGVVVACGGNASSGERVGEAASGVIKGTDSDDSQNAVVLLVMVGGGGIGQCTGTLLAPNLVLTARHCVSELRGEGVACKADGTPIAGGQILSDRAPSSIYVVTGTNRPTRPEAQGQGARLFVTDSKNLCNNDIALVLLKAPVPNAMIAPVRLGPPVAGETITAVGWGVTDRTSEPQSRQQRTGIPITMIGGDTQSDTGPNEFAVGESICSGDSGGPAFSESGGGILGVVSRGGNGTQPTQNPASSCVGRNASNVYTGLAGFKDLILEAYAAAGQEPWLEGEGDPRLARDGDPCSAPSACRSNLCVVGKCAASCEKKACPAGFTCQDSGGPKFCSATPAPGAGGAGGANGDQVTTTTTSCAAAPGPGGQGGWGFIAAAGLAFAAGVRRRRGTR